MININKLKSLIFISILYFFSISAFAETVTAYKFQASIKSTCKAAVEAEWAKSGKNCPVYSDSPTTGWWEGGQCGYYSRYSCSIVQVTPVPSPPPDKCAQKAGQSAGLINVAIPSGVCSSGSAAITNKEQAKQWLKSPMPSCNDGCLTQSSGSPDTSSATQCNTSIGVLYLSVPSKYTGAQCSPSTETPSSIPSSETAPSMSVPQSQNDCPSGTTFGSVNERPMCVKNAPPLNASGVPQTTADDGKACVGDCDKWKPTGQPDTTNGKTGTGTGVDGDGQQRPPVSGGGTADTKVDAKDEEGNDVSGTDKGFGKINQDDVYKSQYKDKSFGAIWSEKSPLLMQTPFIKSLSSSFPSFGSGGSAPKLTLNFSALKLGTHEVPIDSRIWMFIQAIMLITATFTARKIIWG